MDEKANIAEPGKPPRRWFQFRLRTLLIAVTVIPALIWACDRSGVSIGDGWLDVEMRYLVIDANTGQVVPHATVELIDDFKNPNPMQNRITPLTTNANGMASRICHGAGCTWRRGMLGLSETFTAGCGVSWVLRISAAGHEPTDWFIPDGREFDWRSEYLGNHKARATISVPLRRIACVQAETH
jgi:hypothetical protein